MILRSLYAKQLVLLRPAPVVPEFAKDVWDARRMGVATSPLRSDYCLSFAKVMGFLAVTLAAVNIFGGFIVTQRMLQMFRKKR